ncbi:MAG: hypothetical protein JNK82_00550 [Myxococcaceae bacterium]|nr:hypothetical protein [Myxococcaceae bacterium]
MLPWQQPLGQFVGLHSVVAQLPVMQVWFTRHWRHAAPPPPHVVGLWFANGTHVLPLQQPLGHVAAVHVAWAWHVPPLQTLFAAHARQRPPPRPQLTLVWALGGTQTLPTQQPPEQLSKSQGALPLQVPPTH